MSIKKLKQDTLTLMGKIKELSPKERTLETNRLKTFLSKETDIPETCLAILDIFCRKPKLRTDANKKHLLLFSKNIIEPILNSNNSIKKPIKRR